MASVRHRSHFLVALIASFIDSVKREVFTDYGGGAVTGASAAEGTGATGPATATVTALRMVGHAHYENPIAADLVTNVATLDPVVNGALVIAAQPDFARRLQIRIIDGDASISAGILTLVAIGARGQAVNQVVPLTGGTQTVVTTEAIAHITSATVSALAGAVAGDSISIGPSDALGLPAVQIPTPSGFTVFKADLAFADEAVGTVDADAGTIIPTTAPNGARKFDFFYTYEITPVQAAHTHTGPSHTHGAGTFAAGPVTAPIHFDRAEYAVTAAAASSLETSRALLRAVTIAYHTHINDALAHLAVDATNMLPESLTQVLSDIDAGALSVLETYANGLKGFYNTHRAQAGVHATADAGHAITSADATDQGSLNTLLNELKTDLNAHLGDGLATPSWRVVDV